ncbi:hypothetical protein O4J56_18050 [Nocardiopsis sp. RSe5-2]|uniref:Uncharacterized protein n=1 Tax=Nocardiopsis endophytica TaxID=3018445 RepID=A0ABT4U6H2_9ACTN|nr:hypothetical protein [Nocardiopsis endophytica]MDA2812552.1 hypothetical protein [Nocardiopsis endophytica]
MNETPSGSEDTGRAVPEPPLPSMLVALSERLTSGLGAVADAGRDGAGQGGVASGNDAAALGGEDLREAVLHVRRAQQDAETGYRQACEGLFRLWEEQPHTARVLVHRPEAFIAWLPRVLRVRPDLTEEEVEAQGPSVWCVLAGTVDALWEYAQGDTAGAHRIRRWEPLIARMRFLVLAEPFRDLGLWEPSWASTTALGRVFGYDSGVELIRRAREAREVWRAHLGGYQSVPLFDHAPPFSAEEDVRALAFVSGFSGRPLVLADLAPGARGDTAGGAGAPGAGRGPTGLPADRAVTEDVVEHHLLPRFAVVEAWAAVAGRPGAWRAPRQAGWFGAVAGAALLALVSAAVAAAASGALGTWYVAAAFAGAAYAAIGAGTLAHGRRWAMPLMLRFPAAAVVGLIVLVAFHPDWWTDLSAGWASAGTALLIAAAPFGYLLTQVRNHNSGQVPEGGGRTPVRRRVVVRAALATGTGIAHAFLVALLGMVLVAPVFSEDGDRLRTAWSGGGAASSPEAPAAAPGEAPAEASPAAEPPRRPGSPAAILVLATSVCLAAGVFSQILWDDKPVTAPLSHQRWRSER